MLKRKLLWIVPVVIWCCFAFWYTDFGGPMSDEEVGNVLSTLEAQGWGGGQRDELEKFLREDTGRQFIMVNSIDLNENPPEMEGFGPDATASDYVNHYMEHMYVQLFKRACHPVFMGLVTAPSLDIEGIENAEVWDQSALMRYRSRRTFMEIVVHPDMRGRHDYKIAAMTKTIAYPVEPVLYISDLRIQLFLILGLMTALVDMLAFRRVTNN